MTPAEAQAFYEGLSGLTKRRGFADTCRVYSLLKEKGLIRLDEEKGPALIHVAGTNGKGSVCCALSSVLEECGFSTGLFTSPHLIDIKERIRCRGRMIPAEELAAMTALLQKSLPAGDLADLGYFEAFFFAAMLWFSEKQPDYIILETGLGGRLDATNAVRHPAVTVITRIALDHTGVLGDTIPAIAAEKAGILKASVPVVFLDEPREAADIIRERAESLGCPLLPVRANKSLDFSLDLHYHNDNRFTVSQAALYQRENLPLALTAAGAVLGRVDSEAFQKGIDRFRWPSRFEELSPGVILDGAHNPDGMRAFLASVKEDGCKGKRTLILAMLRGKDYRGVCTEVAGSGLFFRIICTALPLERSLEAEALCECFSGMCKIRVECAPSPQEAMEMAEFARDGEDRIYLAGSLYLRPFLSGAEAESVFSRF